MTDEAVQPRGADVMATLGLNLTVLEKKAFSRLAAAKSTCPRSMTTAPAAVTPIGTSPVQP